MIKESQRWIVTRIKGRRSEEIAIVAAKDAASAIATVVKDRGITDGDYISVWWRGLLGRASAKSIGVLSDLPRPCH
jgi:hypothetical protein